MIFSQACGITHCKTRSMVALSKKSDIKITDCNPYHWAVQTEFVWRMLYFHSIWFLLYLTQCHCKHSIMELLFSSDSLMKCKILNLLMKTIPQLLSPHLIPVYNYSNTWSVTLLQLCYISPTASSAPYHRMLSATCSFRCWQKHKGQGKWFSSLCLDHRR